MNIGDILRKGAEFANSDESAREMMVDFKDHKVGMRFDSEDFTVVIKDGTVAVEDGIREDSHAAMQMSVFNMCEAIDNSYDLMEIREKGSIIKGDAKDSGTAVHFMALFPFFDAMVRLYEDEDDFKEMVDKLKSES